MQLKLSFNAEKWQAMVSRHGKEVRRKFDESVRRFFYQFFGYAFCVLNF